MTGVEGWPLLILWGTLVGLDLIAVPQVMIARPLVAGVVAGWIAGDPMAGAAVGIVLELFALEVLPFGAARYPDYGLGAVAGATVAAGAPTVLGLGIAVGVGLFIAVLGELGIQTVRRLNTADLARHRTQVDAGEPAAIAALHLRGLAREAGRAVSLTAIGVAGAWLVHSVPFLDLRSAVALNVTVVGVAVGAFAANALRLVKFRRQQLAWLGLGVMAGFAWVMFA